MASIMDMFRSAPAAPAAPVPGVTAPAMTGAPDNPNLPVATVAAPAAPDPNASPLDAHSKLWENDPTKAPAAPAPLFDIDPAKFNEAIKSADFTKSVPPELLAKAMAGDAAAMTLALNTVAQTAFSHQTMATTKLIEQALNKRDEAVKASMPEAIRRAQIDSNLADSPIFQHAATRPLVDALTAQLASQFPKATAAQVAEQARKFVADFALVVTGKPAADTAKSGEPDWEGFNT